MTQDSNVVRVTNPSPSIGVVTLDRPERRNALDLDVKNRIAESIIKLSSDPAIQVIILTGSEKYFVAGSDLAEMSSMTVSDHARLETDRVFNVLRASKKILIAAIEGFALGGGCELALACDMIIAGSNAKLGQPEIRVGIMPGAGGTQRLLRTIGKYRTMKMVLTGEPISATEAYGFGLISEVCADGEALPRALEIAVGVVAMPPLAVRAIKEVIQLGGDVPLESALALERKAFVQLFDTEDQKEGMNAFLEKRAPGFTGR